VSTEAKRRLLFIIAGLAFALLLAIAAAFVLTYRARAEAARYLRTVMELRIDTNYDIVVTQLRNAQVPLVLPSDCHRECRLSFDFDDKWLYRLRLASPAEFAGRLDFQDAKLVYKSTSIGRGVCCMAVVLESAGKISRASVSNIDSSGHPLKILVNLSALDFSEYRRKAYGFNVACIGSMRACRPDEYLPTINDLE
jgi:hypothetical protein